MDETLGHFGQIGDFIEILELFIKKTPVKECRCKLEALFVRESSSRVRLCMASVLSQGEK